MRNFLLANLCFWVIFLPNSLSAQAKDSDTTSSKTDTITTGKGLVQSIRKSPKIAKAQSALPRSTQELAMFPSISLQQALKGESPGLYINEPSGEPGSIQQMFLRGTPMPLLTAKDVYQSQPLVVLDGIPLSGEHPFAYDIQNYSYNRIGPATNLLSIINMNMVENIEVLKGADAAQYGPLGANGVISITSKRISNKRSISVNSYFGMAQHPSVTTINGDYENAFRQQFYRIYTVNGMYSDDDIYPLYLSDSLNSAYYGPSNWADKYYQNAMIYNIDARISGGTERANFKFAIGNTKNQGVADDTGLDRYNAMFSLNMKPLKWLTFSADVNGTRLERSRNRYERDRFATMNYLPDLSSPLTPNNTGYSEFLSEYSKGYDNNYTNSVQGQGKLIFDVKGFNLVTRFAVDYNEGYRDLFYPSTLMEGSSYASNYTGYNQRVIFDNALTYNLKLGEKSNLHFLGGSTITWDTYKYDYAYAYKGINDYIKINLLDMDSNHNTYLMPTAFPRELTYKFVDKTTQNLVSFYGKGTLSIDEQYSVSLMLRTDGSSNTQPTDRWLFTPALTAKWDMSKGILNGVGSLSDFTLHAGVSRTGRLNVYDNFSQGPQYTADLSYTGNITSSTSNGVSILSRPYTFGWVGYGIPWAYTDALDVGLDLGFKDDRFKIGVNFYTKNDKNQLLGIPAFAEYGYTMKYEAGMNINNTGIDLMLGADILKAANGLVWSSSLNLNHNRNKLKALPGGLDQLVINNRLLKVGESIDSYWLLSNQGIYTENSQVPTVDGRVFSYNGIAFKAGDPIWKDANGDNIIDDNDKSLMGHIFPQVAGSFNNNFSYKKWSLGVDLYFNLGKKVLNEDMASRFDFINHEGSSSMASVKEITFWEKRGDYNKYPLYNPWSSVIPYRVDQDLFLENASFLKMRTLSVGYDLSDWAKKKGKINGLYIYGSAHNLFTITPYSGRDPELVDFTGYDTGYGLPIPRTYTLGVKVDL